MDRLLNWFKFIVVCQIFAMILGESHYSIIAPGTLRPFRKYSVSVTLHQAEEPATIRISIRSPSSSLILSQDVNVQQNESKMVDFFLPQLVSHFNYELRAEGIQGIQFVESSPLYVLETGGPRIYVESDRGTYKPGDTVHFRIYILDEHLRPVNLVEPMRVQIMDAQNNRIKQFKDIKLRHGVFAANFVLSKEPLIGNWYIKLFISGKYKLFHSYEFKVEKYVLPKFSVHLESDRYFVNSDRYIKATVYAKYTFGKYVEGTAILYLKDSSSTLEILSKNYSVSLSNDGQIKADVFLDIGTLNNLRDIIIAAEFTEDLTNVTETTETVITRRNERYNIIVSESDIEFRNKLPYRLKARVQHWNGTAVIDQSKPLTLSLNRFKYEAFMNSDGMAQFEFDFVTDEDFTISYEDSKLIMDNIYGPLKADDFFIQTCGIEMKEFGATYIVGRQLEFEITSAKNIPYLVYVIVSHGNIIRQEYVQMPPDQKSYHIKLNATIDIIPQSYLYVHYILENDLHFCEIAIRLPNTFENQISLEAPTMVRPGQEITMVVRGQPKSHISIVAVDKSSLLLNSKNVLKKSNIINDLLFDRSFLQKTSGVYYPGFVSGVITLTNAKSDEISTYAVDITAPPEHNDNPRLFFPETWIFKDMEIEGPETSFKVKVPDSITTWIVRAYSVNDLTGFGMLDTTLDIQALKPFFLSTNLPYSVKRGEIVSIPITIFNYLEQSYVTEVTLDNSKEQFTFINDENRMDHKTKNTKMITIPANNGKSVAFIIKPKIVGDIDIKITAKNKKSIDSCIEKLKVEPEGIKKQFNQDVAFDIDQGKRRNTKFYAQIPLNIIPDSEYMVFSLSGDIMVSTLENLEDLIKKPYGCGEQNMIKLAPNILVLDYLKALNQFSNRTDLVSKAKQFIEMGYQQELTYRHPSGGYSAFGPKVSITESNWLTAYVTRFFIKGQKYSAIEPRIIQEGLQFLAKQQTENGSFLQRGYLFHTSHQSVYGFTAFVLMAFMEDTKYSKKFPSVIEKGIQFLSSNINSIEDSYSLAVVANVFQATANSQTNRVIGKLKQMAQEEKDLMWWNIKNKMDFQTESVEVTAYALMALLETSGRYGSIFNWLLRQRNSNGGFGSSQDTVVGLQAIIKYSDRALNENINDQTEVKISFVAKNSKGENVKENLLEVNTENQLILQQEELPSSTRSVDVFAMGHGKIFIQFTYQYYITPDNEYIFPDLQSKDNANEGISLSAPLKKYQYFSIKPLAKVSSLLKSLTLAICYTYQPRPSDESETEMVILQVELPSSYIVNNKNVEQLYEEEQISRVEIQKSSTKLVIYFEKIEANKEECLTIMADRIHEVTELKPSLIEMYDYYNRKVHSEILYDIAD